MSILDSVTSGIFKNSGGSILGDLFGNDITLVSYLDTVFSDGQPHSDVIKYFYQQLYRDFAPDINGYTLVFFVPPHLSGYEELVGKELYDIENKDSYMKIVSRIITFAAIDFSPPQSQVRIESVSTRSGSIPIAAEVSETDTMSITFLDNKELDIYMFHHIWVEYIREILEGTIEPNPSYYDSRFGEADNYGAIDYAASCYIVKYRPDMKYVTFVAKCVGIFPQSLPNKELIGSRATNEVVTLPFTYSCSGYREALHMEKDSFVWIFDELDDVVKEFAIQSESPLFGGVLNNVIGPVGGMLNNSTGNAAKLAGIVGDARKSVSKVSTVVKGISNGDYSTIFKINK